MNFLKFPKQHTSIGGDAFTTNVFFVSVVLYTSRLHCFKPEVCGYIPCGLGVDLVYLHNNLCHFKANKEANNIKPISKQINVLTKVHKGRIINMPFV